MVNKMKIEIDLQKEYEKMCEKIESEIEEELKEQEPNPSTILDIVLIGLYKQGISIL